MSCRIARISLASADIASSIEFFVVMLFVGILGLLSVKVSRKMFCCQ
jgi:hypothetical protein